MAHASKVGVGRKSLAPAKSTSYSYDVMLANRVQTSWTSICMTSLYILACSVFESNKRVPIGRLSSELGLQRNLMRWCIERVHFWTCERTIQRKRRHCDERNNRESVATSGYIRSCNQLSRTSKKDPPGNRTNPVTGQPKVEGCSSRVRATANEFNPRLSGYWVCPVTGWILLL